MAWSILRRRKGALGGLRAHLAAWDLIWVYRRSCGSGSGRTRGRAVRLLAGAVSLAQLLVCLSRVKIMLRRAVATRKEIWVVRGRRRLPWGLRYVDGGAGGGRLGGWTAVRVLRGGRGRLRSNGGGGGQTMLLVRSIVMLC